MYPQWGRRWNLRSWCHCHVSGLCRRQFNVSYPAQGLAKLCWVNLNPHPGDWLIVHSYNMRWQHCKLRELWHHSPPGQKSLSLILKRWSSLWYLYYLLNLCCHPFRKKNTRKPSPSDVAESPRTQETQPTILMSLTVDLWIWIRYTKSRPPLAYCMWIALSTNQLLNQTDIGCLQPQVLT